MAVLAGLLIAVSTAGTAHAYWRASGTGTGTVPTKAGVASVITLSPLTVSSHKVTASGTAGISAGYNTSVTVVLCIVNTWPCPAGKVAATLTATASTGTPSYTKQSGNLNGLTVWGRASQVETSGWTDYSAAVGPVTA
jgi:hypothetical protein